MCDAGLIRNRLAALLLLVCSRFEWHGRRRQGQSTNSRCAADAHILPRSLSGLRDLINRALAEVRLGQGLQDRVTIGVAEFIDELTPAALLEAANRGLRFTVHAADANVAVQADRQILSAIVTNLLQNAFSSRALERASACASLPARIVYSSRSRTNAAVSRTGTQRRCFSLSNDGVRIGRASVSGWRSADGAPK